MIEIDALPIQAGQIVGDHYRLESIIGEGGMGTIWEAVAGHVLWSMTTKP